MAALIASPINTTTTTAATLTNTRVAAVATVTTTALCTAADLATSHAAATSVDLDSGCGPTHAPGAVAPHPGRRVHMRFPRPRLRSSSTLAGATGAPRTTTHRVAPAPKGPLDNQRSRDIRTATTSAPNEFW